MCFISCGFFPRKQLNEKKMAKFQTEIIIGLKLKGDKKWRGDLNAYIAHWFAHHCNANEGLSRKSQPVNTVSVPAHNKMSVTQYRSIRFRFKTVCLLWLNGNRCKMSIGWIYKSGKKTVVPKKRLKVIPFTQPTLHICIWMSDKSRKRMKKKK